MRLSVLGAPTRLKNHGAHLPRAEFSHSLGHERESIDGVRLCARRAKARHIVHHPGGSIEASRMALDPLDGELDHCSVGQRASEEFR